MKLKILFIGIICLVGMSSCEDYFNVTPKGSIPVEDYQWQINNLRISMNAVYNQMQQTDYQLSELVFGETMSDNVYTRQDNDGSELCQLLNFQFNNENSYILKRYEVNYRGINLANQVISSVPKLKYNENYSEGPVQIRYILGEAKLCRALFYFNLVRTYGGVVIQPEVSELTNQVLARSSADEVYAYIEKDLREASLLLYRNRWKGSDAGKPNIGAGLGLLMKVLAYQASPGIKLSQTNKAQKWLEAKEIGELFIDGKSVSYDKMLKFTERYSESWDSLTKRLVMSDLNATKETLVPGDVANIHGLVNFEDLFRLKGEFSKESLFEINHFDYSTAGIDIDETSNVFKYTTHINAGPIGISPTEYLITNRSSDPRGLYTVAYRTDHGNSDFFLDDNGNRVSLEYFTIADGYLFNKYMVYPNEGSENERNYRIMRYAEALLWYAEILNETGDQVKATEALNLVRTRAAKLITDECPDKKYNECTSCPLYTIMPYEEIKKNIQYERRIELACEFDRWYDIVRLGLVAEKLYALKNPPDKDSGTPRWRGKYFKKGVNELFPIPQKEIIISNGVITQNFGY